MHPWMWEKISDHERNEALDCHDYALAAFKALSPDMDAADRRLKVAVGKAVPERAVKNRVSQTGAAIRWIVFLRVGSAILEFAILL